MYLKTNYTILLLTFLLTLVFRPIQAQEVEGIVVDKRTKQRISQVFIRNQRTGESVFNNTRGEFVVQASPGDILISTVKGYFTDTLTVGKVPALIISLNRESIYIDEVSVVAQQSAEEILKKRQVEYEKAFRLSGPKDAISLGPTGVGVSVDWIYGFFSKEVKNAKRLRAWIENDYKEAIIDGKFSKDLVSKTTGLTGDNLLIFMHTFRPSYDFISTANEYQLTHYIKNKFVQFKRNPNRFSIPALPKIDLDVYN